MPKFTPIAILILFSSLAGASELTVPYPLLQNPSQIIQKETRRIIHFLKRAFIGFGANYTSERTHSNYGPVIGFQFPSKAGVRLWGGMSQSRSMDLKRDYAMDERFSGVNGHRIGIGVKLSGDLSLDLEYQTINGDQSKKNNSYTMSLSVPLNL